MNSVLAPKPDFAASLDVLLSTLEAATRDGMRTSSLLPIVAEVHAASAPLPGVRDLLRIWRVLLQARASNADDLSAEDAMPIALWFMQMRRYLHGLLTSAERAQLAQLPAELVWLPQIPPRLSQEIERRLSLAPPVCTVMAQTEPLDVTAARADLPHTEGATPAHFPSLETPRESPSDETMGTFDTATPPFDPALSDVAVASSELAAIWLGEEERSLILQAISGDLMPLAERWVTADTEAACAAALEPLLHQCELIVNVLEHIGLLHLARGLRAVCEQTAAHSATIDPEIVLACCAGLRAAFETPAQDVTVLSAPLLGRIPPLDARWLEALGSELARVVIGMDPAFLAARKRHAAEQDVRLDFAPDVLGPVLDGMLRELPGNAARLGTAVRGAVLAGDAASLDEARRVAHTLKGDANTVGVRGLAGITHALEDMLTAFDKNGARPDASAAELLVDATDTIEEIADFLLGRGAHPEGLLDLYQRLLDAAIALEPSTAHGDPTTADDEIEAEPAHSEPPYLAKIASEPAQAAAPSPDPSRRQIRNLTLSSDVLDRLQDLAGETMIVSQAVERRLEALAELRQAQEGAARRSHELLTRLDDLVALRGAALQSAAISSVANLDPLEIDQYNELHVISRQLMESHADFTESLRNLRRMLSELGELRSEQQQVNQELQRSVLHTRLLPFAQIAPRLQRIARQAAKQVKKNVELLISGEQTLLDAELLERIVEPLGHVIRNAIDHGVEDAQGRRRARKAELAPLRIAVGVQGDTATIDIVDDGCGLDFAAIRARAVDLGLLDAAATHDERAQTRVVLLPGFSTRTAATDLSGRGVGLDVVNQRVAQLRGTLQLFSRRGDGLSVKIRVPVTQTIANIVLVRGHGCRTAVISSAIDQIVGFAARDCHFDATNRSLQVTIGDETVAALPIEAIYGGRADISEWVGHGGHGLLLRAVDGNPVLVLVRSVEDVRAVVVKPVSTHLPPIRAVRGIAQLPDGGLAPVVDLDQLLERASDAETAQRALQFAPLKALPRIVVADDSLSARRSLEQLMRDAGYDVDVASDGFEALAQVEQRETAVLLVDMEMPRMNGLEVTRNLRNKAPTRDLPILMITSRTADKHRQLAQDAGVTQMLAKPVSEDTLMSLIADLIATRQARAETAQAHSM